MIQVERLAPSDFYQLKKLGDGYMPDPERSVVVVARSTNSLIGRICLVSPVHAEGIFIDRLWRNAHLMKRLVDCAELEAQGEGVKKLIAYAHGDEMAGYIERLGYSKMPLTVWSKELPCLQRS